MGFLDQSEIDALLNTEQGGDDSSGSAGGSAGSGHGGAVGVSAVALANVPDGFRVHASPEQLRRIEPISVPVVVQLAERTMRLEKVLDISVGTIIEFEKLADSELDLLVNNKPIGTGNAVKCGENFGLRIIHIQPHIVRLLAQGLFR